MDGKQPERKTYISAIFFLSTEILKPIIKHIIFLIKKSHKLVQIE